MKSHFKLLFLQNRNRDSAIFQGDSLWAFLYKATVIQIMLNNCEELPAATSQSVKKLLKIPIT
jgi:hypothetical protein